MIFQNSRYTGKSKIWRMSTLIIVFSICTSIAIAETVLEEFMKNHVKIDISYRIAGILIVLAIYALMTYVRLKKKYSFVYFTDEDRKNLVFRSYHIRIFGKKHTTYKIPIPSFHKFEILETNKHKELVLFQRVQNNKAAKYPGISLSALSPEEIATLSEALQNYSQTN